MKRIAYFDLGSGISGDMLLGALIDLGGDVRVLDTVIEKLGLKDVHIEVEEQEQGVKGKKVKVRSKDQPHRELSKILDKIENSRLDKTVKKESISAFERLGEIEAEIHDEPFEELELHETGMVDSIIDIVGGIALFHDLGIEEAYSSTVSLGEGYTECSHGKLPVPVPAVEKLLKGWSVKLGCKKGELVTPTGAVLLNVLTEQKDISDMRLERIGAGFGSREMEEPNALRVFMGSQANREEPVQVIRFHVDDMSPEILSYALERIREEALDAYTVPTPGKKGRQGWEVTVMVEKIDFEDVKKIIFEETSTLGVRVEGTRRIVANRKVSKVETEWGEARVKVSSEKDQAAPEYESCREIAEREDIPLRKVYEEVKRQYEKEK